MRSWIAICAAIVLLVGAFQDDYASASETPERFVLTIYGATPGGIATAVSAARRDGGLRILLVTPYRRVGGMITNGLTHPDFRTFEARTGLFRELNARVLKHFEASYGPDSQQVKDSLFGSHAGPEVNYRAFSQMLDLPGITLRTECRLKSARVENRQVVSIELEHIPSGEMRNVESRYFVDATYEGDLMAAAGVAYAVGRESQEQYGESLAPEVADSQLQGYNFRLTMTDDPTNSVPVPEPNGYNPEDYTGLVDLLNSGAVKRIFGDPLGGLPGGIYKRQTPKLPNAKRDINDVSHSNVRLSLPNINNGWPEGDHETRQAIFDEHVRHNIGMLYFLQNDPSVPKRFADDAKAWGLCRDELTETHHLPEQLYVREARRMVGRYVFTQRDVERAEGTNHSRAVFQPDSIAMGDYGPNCHGTYHEGPLFGGRHTGEFYKRSAPYQIPYDTLLPKELDNLAVPVACSSSHVGFCALRLEPIWMSLGQAAGEAVALAAEQEARLQDVEPASIRRRLHRSGTATIYVSDVPEESPLFEAAQWWASLGGLVAIDESESEDSREYGQRGKNIIGQYYEAFPDHAVELERVLTPALRRAWNALAKEHNVTSAELSSAQTRGQFIKAAWKQYRRNAK